jgi:hypothetical protein
MRRAEDTSMVLAPFAVGAVAVLCCAGLPALAALFAGLTLATILGVGGGLVALIVAVAGTVAIPRARRRRSCPRTQTPRQ